MFSEIIVPIDIFCWYSWAKGFFFSPKDLFWKEVRPYCLKRFADQVFLYSGVWRNQQRRRYLIEKIYKSFVEVRSSNFYGKMRKASFCAKATVNMNWRHLMISLFFCLLFICDAFEELLSHLILICSISA